MSRKVYIHNEDLHFANINDFLKYIYNLHGSKAACCIFLQSTHILYESLVQLRTNWAKHFIWYMQFSKISITYMTFKITLNFTLAWKFLIFWVTKYHTSTSLSIITWENCSQPQRAIIYWQHHCLACVYERCTTQDVSWG